MPDMSSLLKCSFCNKGQDQVKQLVAGPGIYICDECIRLCERIISAQDSATNATSQLTSTADLDELRSLSNEQLLERLGPARMAAKTLEDNLRGVVELLRAQDTSWSRIGEALGMSRQAAWERFSGED